MKIGKRTVLVNPNVTKFGCMLAILTGWYFWPKEHDYKAYDAKVKKQAEAEGRQVIES